jgi:hypothetical protein
MMKMTRNLVDRISLPSTNQPNVIFCFTVLFVCFLIGFYHTTDQSWAGLCHQSAAESISQDWYQKMFISTYRNA